MARRLSQGLLIVGMLVLTACGPPPDGLLIGRFERHRAEFEELRTAACQLRTWQHINGQGWTDPKMDEAPERRFLSKMRELGVEDLVVQQTTPTCALQLGVWADGFAGTPADYKSFRFTSAIPPVGTTALVRDLDNIPRSDRAQTLERPLGDGWWLEYDSYP